MVNNKIANALKVLKKMCKNVNCCRCPCSIPKVSEKGETIFRCGLMDITPCYWRVDKFNGRLFFEVGK